MMGLLSRATNSEKVTSYDEWSINAQAGGNNNEVCEQNHGPIKVMIAPSILKVNLSHLAYFDTHRDRFVVEAAPLLLEQFLPLEPGNACICQAVAGRTIGHEHSASTTLRLRPY
jgi:hypothetical protein